MKFRLFLSCLVLGSVLLNGYAQDVKPFTAEEAEACLTASDREVIERACEKVQAYDVARENDAMTESVEKEYDEAIEELKDLMRKIDEDGDSPSVNMRHAAVNWLLIGATYNRFNGTCASQVMFAARRGLIEALQIMENPPRGLTTYLLPPGDPRRIEDEE